MKVAVRLLTGNKDRNNTFCHLLRPKASFSGGHILAVDKSLYYSPKSGHIWGVGEFRPAPEGQFIDGNTLALSHPGKLLDNVCVYESVNICAWQQKCVFDLAARHSKHTGLCVAASGLRRANTLASSRSKSWVMRRGRHSGWFCMCLEKPFVKCTATFA